MKYDVITFGSASLDVFLKTHEAVIRSEKKFINRQAVCFPFAAKVEIKNLYFSSGGGGTNVAASLALQGLKTAYCGKIGKDFSGEEVLKDLKKFKVETPFIIKTEEKPTNLSVIFSWGRERTCFVWRGASECLRWSEIPREKLEAKWFYLAPLSGRLISLFGPLVNFARERGIKVFSNLGDSQIKLEKRKLQPILKKIDVVLLNQEEASLLTGIPYQKEKELFRKLDEMIDGLAIMTKGKEGAIVSDGAYSWSAKTLPAKVVEKTGAGDAFGAGFLSRLLVGKEPGAALQFGIANSVGCLKELGTKNGLLKKNAAWPKVKVLKKKL